MDVIRNYLGHSITSSKSPDAAAFLVRDEDIVVDDLSTWMKFAQIDDLSNYEDNFHAKFSAGISYYDGIKMKMDATGKQEKSSKRSGGVLSVVCYQRCHLRRGFPHLDVAPNAVGLSNLGVSYISQGRLACGFHVILSTDIKSEDHTLEGNVDISAAVEIIEAGIEAGTSSKKTKSRKNRGVQVKGFGGYVPSVDITIPLDDLEKELTNVHSHFQEYIDRIFQNNVMNNASFYYDEDSIESIEQKFKISMNTHTEGGTFSLTQGNHGMLTWSSTEESEVITISPCRVLGITDSIWENDFVMHLKGWDEENEEPIERYFQIVNGELLLQSDDEDNGDDFTEIFRPTRWMLRRSCQSQGLRNQDIERFLCGVSDDIWWTLTSPTEEEANRVCLAHKHSQKRHIVEVNRYDPLKNEVLQISYDEPFPPAAVDDDIMKEGTVPNGMPEKQVQLVEDFVKRIFPKLALAEEKDLVLLLGNTGRCHAFVSPNCLLLLAIVFSFSFLKLGAGKSSFVNAMLGHNFTTGYTLEGEDSFETATATSLGKYFDVVDKTRPYAPMGTSNFVSTTTEPDLYVTTKEHSGHEETFADLPGFCDTEGRDSFHTFGMFMLKELSHDIKAVVVMISYAEIISAKGPAFEKLVKILNKIFWVKPPHLRENITFVINMKPVDENAAMATSAENVKRDVWRLLMDFRDNCQKAKENASVKKDAINDKKSKKKSKKSKRYKDSYLKALNDEAECNDILSMLNLITVSNIVVWQSIKDTTFRDVVWHKLSCCNNRFLGKDGLRFELDRTNVQDKWRWFDQYISTYFLKPLKEFDDQATSAENLIVSHTHTIKLLRTKASGMQARVEIEEVLIAALREGLENMTSELETYSAKIVNVRSSVVPKQTAGWFTRASYTENFVCDEEGTRYTHYEVVSKGNFSFAVVSSDGFKKTLQINNGGRDIVTHSSAKITVTRSILWCSIPEDDVTIYIKTQRRFCKQFQETIKKKEKEIADKKADFKRKKDVLKSLEEHANVDTKVAHYDSQIKVLKDSAEKAKASIESDREENMKTYELWYPVYKVLEKSILSKDRSVRSQYISYPNIRMFLYLCQKWYCEGDKADLREYVDDIADIETSGEDELNVECEKDVKSEDELDYNDDSDSTSDDDDDGESLYSESDDEDAF